MSAALAERQVGRRDHTTSDDLIGAIDEFASADRMLLHPDRTRQYAGMWAAAYDGEILADTDLHALTSRLEQRGLPLGRVAIRFIESDGIAA